MIKFLKREYNIWKYEKICVNLKIKNISSVYSKNVILEIIYWRFFCLN